MNGVSKTAKASQHNGLRNVNRSDSRVRITKNSQGFRMIFIPELKRQPLFIFLI